MIIQVGSEIILGLWSLSGRVGYHFVNQFSSDWFSVGSCWFIFSFRVQVGFGWSHVQVEFNFRFGFYLVGFKLF